MIRQFKSETSNVEIAWAAGLFEGEGWAGFYKTPGRTRKDGTKSRPEGYFYPKLAMSMTDLDVLQKFQSIVGGGITGPYTNGHNKPIWYWRETKPENAKRTARLLYPYLCGRRQERIREVFGEKI